MYKMQEFKNGPLKAHVRTLMIEGAVWFVLMDVARVFGYRDAGRVLHLLRPSQYVQADDAIKKALGVRGKPPYLVTESGFYRLAMQSTNEEAQPFQLWVEDEVLPTIRKAHSVGIDVLNDTKRAYEEKLRGLEAGARRLEAGARRAIKNTVQEHSLELEAEGRKQEHLSHLVDKQDKLIEEMTQRMRALGARSWDIPDIRDM